MTGPELPEATRYLIPAYRIQIGDIVEGLRVSEIREAGDHIYLTYELSEPMFQYDRYDALPVTYSPRRHE